MYDYDRLAELTLVKRAKKKDTKAFAELYQMVYQDLYRFALCTMRHPQDAEDMVSEAIVKAYVNLPGLRKAESFRSWIFKILMNSCKHKWAAVQHEDLGASVEEGIVEPDLAMSRDVRDAFAAATEEERLIVGLSVFGGYNSTEIGEMMTLNANTVRSKRSRALEKMGSLLE